MVCTEEKLGAFKMQLQKYIYKEETSKVWNCINWEDEAHSVLATHPNDCTLKYQNTIFIELKRYLPFNFEIDIYQSLRGSIKLDIFNYFKKKLLIVCWNRRYLPPNIN